MPKEIGGFTLIRTLLRRNLVIVQRGFTLIELIIVIAIIGVLTVIVLVAINPIESQARARDAGRISAVTQLGHSIQAYYTSVSSYPSTGNWAQDLLDKGVISTFPSGIKYVAYNVKPCKTYVQPDADKTFCYDVDLSGSNGVIVFAKAESTSYTNRCTSGEQAYFVFSSVDGHGGTICSNGDPIPWAAGSQTYVD
jgi:prepilin-type N-terminal cleavage/methylation domain-containing protein